MADSLFAFGNHLDYETKNRSNYGAFGNTLISQNL